MATKKPAKNNAPEKKSAAKSTKSSAAKTASKKPAAKTKSAPKKTETVKAPQKAGLKKANPDQTSIKAIPSKKKSDSKKPEKKSSLPAKSAKINEEDINDSISIEEKPGKQTKKSALAAAEHKRKLNDKIRQLIHLSKEKGFLTNQDINKYLTETLREPEEFDNVINILENLDVEILDTDEEVESFKHRKEESEERQTRALHPDTLDDPVRMYLKQMGQVPLLTREQEVSISKRIEAAEMKATKALFAVALTNDFQIDMAVKLAEREGVDVRLYRIIYDAIDEVKAAMKGMLAPKFKEVILGRAEVRQTFRVSGVGTIAGCMVTEGLMRRNGKVRLLRDNVVVFEGNLDSLKRFKDDVREVAAGYECGIGLEGYNDMKEQDVIECFVMEEVE